MSYLKAVEIKGVKSSLEIKTYLSWNTSFWKCQRKKFIILNSNLLVLLFLLNLTPFYFFFIFFFKLWLCWNYTQIQEVISLTLDVLRNC